MSSPLDRIAQIQKKAIILRLDRGAEILGRLWRDGQKPPCGWFAGCQCKAQTDFCKAKQRWVGLYFDYHGGQDLSGEFGVVEAMSVRQALATGLTFLVKNDMTPKPIKVGPKGTDWKTLVDLAQLDSDDQEQGIAAVLMIQGVGL